MVIVLNDYVCYQLLKVRINKQSGVDISQKTQPRKVQYGASKGAYAARGGAAQLDACAPVFERTCSVSTPFTISYYLPKCLQDGMVWYGMMEVWASGTARIDTAQCREAATLEVVQ